MRKGLHACLCFVLDLPWTADDDEVVAAVILLRIRLLKSEGLLTERDAPITS